MIDHGEIMEWQRKREAWKNRLLMMAENGDFAGVVCGMAENAGDRGDIKSMIENFCANADPLDGKEAADNE